jgi:membrane-associated PAP2 superfamily phosphatase
LKRFTAIDRKSSTSAEQQLPRVWIIAPLLLLLALLAVESTSIDRDVSLWFFDTGTRSFPLRNDFLFDTVLHHWAKYAVILATGVAGILTLLTWVVPALKPKRKLLLFVVMAMTLAPVAVTSLKQLTDRPCPWDLVEFGGSMPYTPLFQQRNLPHARGLCFPAGHASTGFALMAFYFAAFRERRYRLARALLFLGMLTGLLLGLGRIAQGAHFVSHVLWAGLVCWLVMLTLHLLLPEAAAGRVAPKKS